MTREKCGARVYVHGDEERTCANYADTCRWHKGWRELCEKIEEGQRQHNFFYAKPIIADPVRPEPNTVDHPRHYNVGKIEAITVIEDWNLGFNLGNTVKYIARADHKGNAVEDLKKALWYLQRELARRNMVSR
jgi:hypothetical protein